MSEEQLENRLYVLLTHGEEAIAEMDEYAGDNEPSIMSVLPFHEAGLYTDNKGLVLITSEGDEFQLTIVKSR